MIDTTVTVSTLTFEDMCFRITDLEAKLQKAVVTMKGVRLLMEGFEDSTREAFELIDATLGEIK